MKEAILKNTGERIAVREAYPIGDDIIPFAQYYTTEDGTIYIDTDLDFNTKNPMTPTKEQQAQEYVLNRQTVRHNAKSEEEATMADFDKTRKVWDTYDMEQAYLDGYAAAEQSQWRSVEDELPSNDADVLVSDENGLHIASYWDGEWCSVDDDFTRQPQMWMPIPSLPDTNTEKI